MIQRLTDEELKSLIEAYNAEKDRNASTRIHCVILWGKGYDWATIKDVLMISEGMIHEVIKKYRMSGISSLTENRYKGHNYKMNIPVAGTTLSGELVPMVPDNVSIGSGMGP